MQTTEKPEKKPYKQFRDYQKIRKINEEGFPLHMKDFEFVRYMKAHNPEYTIAEYTDFLKIFKDCLEYALQKDDSKVHFLGFGTFTGVVYPSRMFKHPKTGEYRLCESGKLIRFKSARGLKDRYRVLRDTRREEKLKKELEKEATDAQVPKD